MVRAAYSLFLYVLSPFIFLQLWLRGLKASAYRKRWDERLGFYRMPVQTDNLVIHCASVGEIMAAGPLIKQLMAKFSEHRVTITCNTPTGSEQIAKIFGNSVQHIYLPLDFHGSVKRFLNKWRPAAIIILETELWPNLLLQSKQRQIPVLVLNARLSEKSLKGYQLFGSLSRSLMHSITMLAGHNQEDVERFKLLGLQDAQSTVVGSIKFDIQLSQQVRDNAKQLKQALNGYKFVWVAGSTHPGEHEQIIAAHRLLCSKYAKSLLIIAPRHPEQFDNVADLLDDENMAFARWSARDLVDQPVLLANTMGEMLTFLGAAHCAFIGGSLIDRGGHNPLEAAALAIPVITGPSYYNFKHIFPPLIAKNACNEVDGPSALCEQLAVYAGSPEQAKLRGEEALKIVQKNCGAIEKTLNMLAPYLSK
ncbi:MAG: lipid IV(A) 3-deoxy-D-manno-octulosonic acid transferase [Porticoccaceae bacterium]|nr:lipid IV(A) 3-deoxy-D-manno-octulosonic acid transferase [Porticoccaceae bacterium]